MSHHAIQSDHHHGTTYPGPLLSTSPCHLDSSDNARQARHDPLPRRCLQNPSRIVITTHRHARACTGMPRYTPEHAVAPSPQSTPTSLLLHRASPRHQLPRRHARIHAEALSPSSPSMDLRRTRRRTCIIPSRPLLLSLRQLQVENRLDVAYPLRTSPCPFTPPTAIAMLAPSQHPPDSSPSYK